MCSRANAELVESLGAEAIPYNAAGGEQALEAALRYAGPFDLVFDTVTSPEDRDYEPLSRRPGLLKPGAKHVAINGRGTDFLRALLGWPRKGYELVLKGSDPAQLAQLAAWVAEGKLKPVTAGTFPFTRAGVADAFALIASRRAKGKVVVSIVAESAAGDAARA